MKSQLKGFRIFPKSEGKKMKARILVIDDVMEMLMLMMEYLVGEGYEVMAAQNGQEALSLVANHKPDLIISDVMMPQMGGFELMAKLRNNPQMADVPIIFFSGKDAGKLEN